MNAWCVPYIVDRAKPRKIVNVEIAVKRSSNDGSFHHTLGKFSKDNMNREHESKLKGMKATFRTRNLPLQLSLVNSFFFFFFFCSRGHLCRHVVFKLLNLPNRKNKENKRARERGISLSRWREHTSKKRSKTKQQ